MSKAVTRVLKKNNCNEIPLESHKESSVELTREKTVEQERKTKYSSHTVDLEHCLCDPLATCDSLGFRAQYTQNADWLTSVNKLKQRSLFK